MVNRTAETVADPMTTLKISASCRLVMAAIGAAALLGPAGATAARFKIIYSFTGGSDGSFPHAGVIRDTAGNLYGTTYDGGGDKCAPLGCGTVFRIAPDGTETLLHSFVGGRDGAWPWDRMIRDKDDNLYSTTITGGKAGCSNSGGCGTVFRVAPDGTETVLHAFAGGIDGQFPYAGLAMDAKGNLYGATEFGGTGYYGCTDGFGSGTIFKITADGREKVLHSFTGSPDGCLPYGQLIMDTAGNLYGTTAYGGSSDCPPLSCGTVFRLAPDGAETVLYSFRDAPDGETPESRLTMDATGNLYGTTVYGGAAGAGAVFMVAPDGTEKVLYSFCSQPSCADGFLPYAGLYRDRKGYLYGTTGYGGNTSCVNGCGLVFKLAPDGGETVLHAFSGGRDGQFPVGDLTSDNAGHLYGTAGAGGSDCAEQFDRCGNVFRIDR
jgi:uncharacterized repeat protein (TIGR03803 family)